MKKQIAALVAGLLVSFAPAAPAFAHPGHEHAAVAQSAEGDGVVRAVNAQAGTVMIAHGPIAALSWPAMTMAFPVQSAALLNGVAVGAQVHFTLVNHEGHPMVSELHVVPAAH